MLSASWINSSNHAKFSPEHGNLAIFKTPEFYKKKLEVENLLKFEIRKLMSSIGYKKLLLKTIISIGKIDWIKTKVGTITKMKMIFLVFLKALFATEAKFKKSSLAVVKLSLSLFDWKLKPKLKKVQTFASEANE